MRGAVLDHALVVQARYRIKETVKTTPLDSSPWLSRETGATVWLKKEQISITGSYKERGALNKIMSLSDSQRECGVVCSSAGNHAQAVSHHATRLGINTMIVMPLSTPRVKVKRTQEFGGTVELYGTVYDEAYARAKEIEVAEGRTFIHPFDDPLVCAGQGTVALEMLEQCPNLEVLVVPIGGGGLISGMATAAKAIKPDIRIVGVQATAMPGMFASWKQGAVTPIVKQSSIADGISVQTVGSVTFAAVQRLVDDIVTVDEDDIAAAVLHILEVEKNVVEPSGAVGVAALQQNKIRVDGKQVGVVLTGGNIDMTLLGRIIEQGMAKDGRMVRLRVTNPDIPGSLGRLTTLLGNLGVNIVDIAHERAFMSLSRNTLMAENVFTLQTRGDAHKQELLVALAQAGYQVHVH